VWWTLAARAFAACGDDPEETIVRAASSLETAFTQMDADLTERSRRELLEALPCLRHEPADVVAVHRAIALGAFFAGEDRESELSWAAVRALDPGWAPPASLLVPGSPADQRFQHANPSGETLPLTQPLPGGWTVDGAPAHAVPTDRAFLLVGRDQGGVVWSGYVYEPADVPWVPLPSAARRRARAIGTSSAVGLAAGAAAALAIGAAARGDATGVVDTSTLAPLTARARGATAAGVVCGASAAAIGVTTWTVRW
jgi:hypothetical protein